MDRIFLLSLSCDLCPSPTGERATHARFRGGAGRDAENANIEAMIRRHRIPVFSDMEHVNEFGPVVISRVWTLFMPLDMDDDHPAASDFFLVVEKNLALEGGDGS